jgi:hypothetical protein
VIARYLFSSIEHLEQIEILFEQIGYPSHQVTDQHRTLAERAKVPPPPESATVDSWLRRLPPSDANRVIDELQREFDSCADRRTHHEKGTP